MKASNQCKQHGGGMKAFEQLINQKLNVVKLGGESYWRTGQCTVGFDPKVTLYD